MSLLRRLWFGRRHVSHTDDVLARLEVTVEVMDHATKRLEASARLLDDVTKRHLRAIENGGNHAEA